MARATENTNTDSEKVTSPEKSTEGDASKGKKFKENFWGLMCQIGYFGLRRPSNQKLTGLDIFCIFLIHFMVLKCGYVENRKIV